MSKAIQKQLDTLKAWHGVVGATLPCTYEVYRETVSGLLGIRPDVLDAAQRTGLISTAFAGAVTYIGGAR